MKPNTNKIDISKIDINLKPKLTEILKSIGINAVNDLKQKSPKRTGDYSRAWNYKLNEEKPNVTIYVNSKDYKLTHLLEFGHKKKNNKGFVLPKKHLEPVYEKYADVYMRKINELAKDIK